MKTKAILTWEGPRPNPGDKYHLAALLTNPASKIEIEYIEED